MNIRSRRQAALTSPADTADQPEAEVAGELDLAGEPVVTTPLTDDATAAAIDAAAERHRQAAEDARQRAGHEHGEAARLLADARAQVDRITTEAEALARTLSGSAAIAEREAETLDEHARVLAVAASNAAEADRAEARAGVLEAERHQLADQVADIGTRLSRLAADKRDLEPQLAEATDSADLDLMTGLRGRLDSIRDLEASLTARRTTLLARTEEIGDGTETFTTHPLLRVLPPLALAYQAAAGARQGARQALNRAFPGRPEAVADAAREEWRLIFEAQAERLTGEVAAQQAPRRQSVVHL